MNTNVDLLIIAALKQEIASLLSGMSNSRVLMSKPGHLITGNIQDRSLGVLVCGVGGSAAAKALAVTLDKLMPVSVLIAGWSGALTDSLSVGDLILVDSICYLNDNPENKYYTNSQLNRLVINVLHRDHARFSKGTLVTSDRVVDESKLRSELSKRFKSNIVDMETSYLADILTARGIPFAVLRAVTDSADERIGVDFDKIPLSKKQRAIYWASHPNQLRSNMKLKRGLKKASDILNIAIMSIVTGQNRNC